MNKLAVRNLIYKSLGTADKILRNDAKHIVLCYHSIEADTERFSVNKDTFITQVQQLSKNRTHATSSKLKEIIKGNNKTKGKTFTLTFDDGYKNLLSIRDFLKQMNIRPTLFTLPFDSQPDFDELGLKFQMLSKEDVLALREDGWEIGCHSFTHADFSKCSIEELKHEIIDSKDSLERDLDSRVMAFAYPKGKYTKTCEELAKTAGYEMVFTMDDRIINKHTNLLRIPRIGIDRTHTQSTFEQTTRPSNILFRKAVKAVGFTGL